jgi:hypothetical protein
MEIALIWPGLDVTRREAHLVSKTGAKVQFPSCSWVCWSGTIYFAEIFGSPYVAILILDFYFIDPKRLDLLEQDYHGDDEVNSETRSNLQDRLRMGNATTDI